MKKDLLTMLLMIGILMGMTSCVNNTSDSVRKTIDFNLDWFFMKSSDGDNQPSANNPLWTKVNIPHDFSLEGPFINPDATEEVKNQNLDHDALGLHLGTRSTGYLPGGIGWYKKTFSLPGEYKNKQISIIFDGIYMYCDVYLNGTKLGHHHYGYSSFSYNITPYLKWNEENVLLVKAENRLESRWYAGSGIYRKVNLIITNPLHIDLWGTYITTTDINEKDALVSIVTSLKNDGTANSKIVLTTSLFNNEGIEVASLSTKEEIAISVKSNIKQELKVRAPKLWSLEEPHLYKAISELRMNGHLVDNYETTFGIRSINFDAEKGFTLNGKQVKLKGVCLHHDNGILGAEAYAWSDERRVLLMKEMGANAIRCAHNPPSVEFLDACDKYGILVIDEAFDEWRKPKANGYAPYFDKWWKDDIKSMIYRDRNHPSIMMWSIGNEVPEQGSPDGAVTANLLSDFVRNLDPTRPTTHATQPGGKIWGGVFPSPDYFDAVDIAGYNYEKLSRKKGGSFVKNHEEFPKRIMYHSESQMSQLFNDWMLIKKSDFILGDFVWTGMDYLGEVGCGNELMDQKKYPAYIAMCGDVDICGFRKPRSYYRELLWNEEETVYATVRKISIDGKKYEKTPWGWTPTITSWTWDLPEGTPMVVDIYSGCDTVELFINNRSMGKKSTSESTEFIATYEVPYDKGELKTLGYSGGEIVNEHILKSANLSRSIKLTVDRDSISADGTDVAYIVAEMVDEKGLCYTPSTEEISFVVEGPASIAGIGNSSPYVQLGYPFHGSKTKMHEGRCLLIIRSTDKAGKIKVIATAKGKDANEVYIESI